MNKYMQTLTHLTHPQRKQITITHFFTYFNFNICICFSFIRVALAKVGLTASLAHLDA